VALIDDLDALGADEVWALADDPVEDTPLPAPAAGGEPRAVSTLASP
jgi:hypothetical protein